MPTLRDIARDPDQAMRDLEKKLGAEPGQLRAEMDALSEAYGKGDWAEHLPYDAAHAYYGSEQIRADYEQHVDHCRYCKALLETMHPVAEASASYAAAAKRVHVRRVWVRRAVGVSAVIAIAALSFGVWTHLSRQPPPPQGKNVCVAGGGTASGCSLLERAAQLETRAGAMIVAGLAESGVAETDLQRVTTEISESRKGEKILAYLEQSESGQEAARTFETAFVGPVRRSADSGTSESAADSRVVQTWVSDVHLGTQVDPARTTSSTLTFQAGEPVHLTTQLEGAPGKTPVTVVWYGPQNERMREETTWIREGEKALSFTAADTARWASGDYRAELWIANSKVKQEPFEIRKPSRTD